MFGSINTVVVPLVGTWIETNFGVSPTLLHLVVPLVGTWIETTAIGISNDEARVVPLVGTWIETCGSRTWI